MSCSSFVVFWPKLSDWLFTSWNIYLDFLRPELLLAELPLSPNQPVSELFQLKRSGGYGYWPFFFLTSLLEYNCFTLLCSFLLHNKVNQLYVYIYPHIFFLLHLPPTLPIPPLSVVTKHRADLPVLWGCFPLAIYFTFGSVYMSMPLSHFVPAYPSPFQCPQVHSLCLHLYSCPAPRFSKTIFFNF